MRLNSFGSFIRNYRIENNILLGEMAKELNISVTDLSALEYGCKRIPNDMEERIVSKYKLTSDEKAQLHEAISEVDNVRL